MMEFYINHTLQEIERTPSVEWEEDDHIERTTIRLDIEEEFFIFFDELHRYCLEQEEVMSLL